MVAGLEALVQFEEEEIERFLSIDYPLEEIKKVFFPGVTAESYALLRQETKKGIKAGVAAFLQKRVPHPASLYHLPEPGLYDFCFDDSTRITLKERLIQTPFKDEKHLNDYCDDVCKGYRGFIDTESLGRYEDVFGVRKKAQYG